MSDNYSISIKDMPENMRPREKLIASGESNLSDTELLALIIGNGTVKLSALELAQQILTQHSSLRFL